MTDALDALGAESWGDVLNMMFIGMFIVTGGAAVGNAIAPEAFPVLVTLFFIFGGTYWFYQSSIYDQMMGNGTEYRSARR